MLRIPAQARACDAHGSRCCFARRLASPRPRSAPRRAAVAVRAMAPRPVRAALFDMDGTLLDIEPLSTLAINQHVEPLGGHVDLALKRKILGKRATEWTRIVIDECGLQGKTTPEELEAAWERNLLALYPTAAVLPGVERLTAHLAACGVPMAVATSSSAKALAAKRQPHGPLFARFAAFVTAEDVARGKPAPDAFLAAARALGVPPADCVVFEDAQSGVEAGRAAGCAVVAVPDATLHADTAPFAEAHVVLRSLDDFDPAAWGLPPYPAWQ